MTTYDNVTTLTDVPSPPPADASAPTLQPVLDAIDRVESVVAEHERTIKAALSALRTLMLQHYEAVQSRVDGHAARLARLEALAHLPPMAAE